MQGWRRDVAGTLLTQKVSCAALSALLRRSRASRPEGLPGRVEMQVAGKIVRPRQQGIEGGGIREIPVRQLFQTVFEVREGF